MSTTSAMETVTVTDQNGVRYELTKLLDEGRQGKVYATERGRLAVKIATGGKGNQAKRELLKNQLAHVRRLPLRDLALAKPLAMLRPPHMGYVMEFLTDMVAIKTLISPQPGEKRAADFSLSAWYIQGGGLRKRLLVLGRVAHVLSQLHGKGLAYGDLSPANVFISKSRDAHEVWLIDTDNLRYASAPCGRRYLPHAWLRGPRGGERKIRCYPLGRCVLFRGDRVRDAVPPPPRFSATWSRTATPDPRRTGLCCGELPWVDDPDDDSNRATPGLPRQLVLSPRLKAMFHSVFGPGRGDPTKRPRAMKWAERLYGAADATIECPACSGSFYFTSPQCPWCNTARPSFVHAFFLPLGSRVRPTGRFSRKAPRRVLCVPCWSAPLRHPRAELWSFLAVWRSGKRAEPWAKRSSRSLYPTPYLAQTSSCMSLDDEVYTLFSPTGRKTEIGPVRKGPSASRKAKRRGGFISARTMNATVWCRSNYAKEGAHENQRCPTR